MAKYIRSLALAFPESWKPVGLSMKFLTSRRCSSLYISHLTKFKSSLRHFGQLPGTRHLWVKSIKSYAFTYISGVSYTPIHGKDLPEPAG